MLKALLLSAAASASSPADLRCLPQPGWLERGAPAVMDRDDARRAGPMLLDEVTLLGFSMDGKLAYVERPAATRPCMGQGGARTLVVENPLTKVVECEAPLGDLPEPAARRRLLEQFGLEALRRCCDRLECDYCLDRDPRTSVGLGDYPGADAFGWSSSPRVAYATDGRVRPADDHRPECLPSLVVKDLATDRELLRSPLTAAADRAQWEAVLERFRIEARPPALRRLHSDRQGFQTEGGDVGIFWGQPRHVDPAPPPCRITLWHSARGVKQIGELGAGEVTSCGAIFPLAAAVSPFEPRAAFVLAVGVPGAGLPVASSPAAPARTRRFRVVVLGAHLEKGFGLRQTLDLLARGVDASALSALGAQLRAPGARPPPAAEVVPILARYFDPTPQGGGLCAIADLLVTYYPGETRGMAIPILRASRRQGYDPCQFALRALIEQSLVPGDVPALVELFREAPDDPLVTLELLLRHGGAAPPVMALLQDLVTGAFPLREESLLAARCRAAVATKVLAPALKARLAALERLAIAQQNCGADDDPLLLRDLWRQALAEIGLEAAAPAEWRPQVSDGDLDQPIRDWIERGEATPGSEDPETALDLGETPTDYIFSVGHWARHRAYVACSGRFRGAADAGREDECCRCAVLPTGFARFDPETLPCDRAVVVPDDTSGELRADAARLARSAEGGPACDLDRRLVELGLRGLPSLNLASCGLVALGAPDHRLGWTVDGFDPRARVEMAAPPSPGPEQPLACFALDDGTFAVLFHRVIGEDPRREGQALVRVTPPSRAAVASGWLGSAGVGAAAFYAADPYVATVGFSRKGRFAWLVARPGAKARLTIADLVHDRVVAIKELPFGGEGDLQALEQSVVAEVERAGIGPPFGPPVRYFPWSLQADTLRAHLRPEPGGGCGVYLEGERAGSKRVALLSPDQARREPRLLGAVASPFEARVALGVTLARGPGEPRDIAFFGAHLGSGFRSPAHGPAVGYDPGSCTPAR